MSELTSLLRHSVIALAEASAPLDGPIIMFQELRWEYTFCHAFF